MTTPEVEPKTYVVEHLDPELEEWSTLEYKTIAQECTDAGVVFVLTNAPDKRELSELLRQFEGLQTEPQSVDVVFASKKDRVCLLDPGSTNEPTSLDLSPEDAQKFDVFLFGGIKGDHLYQLEDHSDGEYDERAQASLDKTSLLRKRGFYERRKLGDIQMTTDTAVRVTRQIIQNQMRLEDIRFVDFPECKINKHESIEMPFRYVVNTSGNPIMPAGMLELLERDSEQSIEDLL